jgi:PAS domain S-box-containing protein
MRRGADAADDLTPLQAMLDHVAQGAAMFDAQGCLVAWNRPLQEILDLPREVMARGMHIEQLVRAMGARGDYGERADAVAAAIRLDTAALDQPYAAERMLADGRVLEFRRTPLPDGGFVATYADVTESRHNAYLHQDAARELRAILGKAPVALAVIGQEDGLLKHVNTRFRRLFGLETAQPTDGMAIDLYVAAQDRDRILSAQADRASVDFEAEVSRADGSKFWALISSVRFVFEWEPATLTSFHDISDRKRAEAGLRDELERKRNELSEARILQLELKPPPFRGAIGEREISLDVVLEPAKEVGGDLVDHFLVDDRRLVLILGDVSNKGAGPAMMMARTHSLFRSLLARPDADALFAAPEQAIGLVNAALAKDNATRMFVTLLLASFDAASGTLAYVRAGHIPPFVHRSAGPIERLDAAGGPPLGLKADAAYKSASVSLAPSDQLLIVTDGITEAVDPDANQFGEPRVEEFLATVMSQEADPLAHLIAAVRTFEDGQPAFDDVAAILMRVAERKTG